MRSILNRYAEARDIFSEPLPKNERFADFSQSLIHHEGITAKRSDQCVSGRQTKLSMVKIVNVKVSRPQRTKEAAPLGRACRKPDSRQMVVRWTYGNDFAGDQEIPAVGPDKIEL